MCLSTCNYLSHIYKGADHHDFIGLKIISYKDSACTDPSSSNFNEQSLTVSSQECKTFQIASWSAILSLISSAIKMWCFLLILALPLNKQLTKQPYYNYLVQVFSCFGQYFCLHFEAFQLGMAPVYIAFLRFMGDDAEAKNYSYSLEVGGTGRKMIWQGVPRSIRDSHRKVRDSYDGLIIQRNMALFFSGGDRKELKLRVTGRIWKEQ